KLDLLGNVLFSGGLTVFLVGLMLGALIGWAPVYLGVMMVGMAMVAGFVLTETKVRYPLMDLSLFRIKAFATGMASNLLASVARGGVSLVLVFYFQGVLLLDAFRAGLWLIPYSVAFVTLGPLSGYLSDKVGSRGLSTAGLLVTSVALFWFGLFPFGNSSDYLELLVPMVLAGAGGGMFVAPNVASVMNATPAARRGIASGMNSTLVNTGFLLSLGLAFAVMAASVPTTVLQGIFAGTASSICPPAGVCVVLERFVGSLHSAFLIMGFVSLFAAVPAYMTRKQRADYRSGPTAPPE
ncbi:MAG: MFS transporter, partial [Nitrososphaerota archaeon]|nr:MFS transporter [Nitrososphaerota archaeon]